MATHAGPRIPLSRERVLAAAVKIADEQGIESLTMRRLAEELGAEAMSLYYHVAKKDDVLDGVVDVIMGEIQAAVDADVPDADWRKAMRQRVLTARDVMLRHRWAPAVFETRTEARPAVLRYFDGVLGLMRGAGFSYDLAHHALHALGSRLLGFTQELFDPGTGAPDAETMAAMETMVEQLPHLAGMMMSITHDGPESTLGWCDDQSEFEFGLDLILDGLERLRESGWRKADIRAAGLG